MFYENLVRKDTESDKKNKIKDDPDATLPKVQKTMSKGKFNLKKT